MHWIDSVGYFASALVFLTFCMKTILPLRAVAICSNVAFVCYGYLAAVYPVLALHLVLLPINAVRTRQILQLVRRVEKAATGDFSVDWLRPYMKAERYPPGAAVFHRGDRAERLFMIISGEVGIGEIGQVLRPGELFGEIGLFSPERTRTQTATCLTAVELLWITEGELAELCYAHPSVSFHFLRLITNRMMQNVARAEERARVMAVP